MFNKTLLYIYFLIPIIPYLGILGADWYRYVILSIFIFLTIVLILKSTTRDSFKLPRYINNIVTIYFIIFIWMLFSIFYNIAFNNIPFVYTDMGELIRPLLLIVGILSFYLVIDNLLKRGSILTILINSIFILSIFNFMMTLFPYIHLEPFATLSGYYGEGKLYSKGYAAFRAFGIIGQPGKEALFSAILILISIILLEEKLDKKRLYFSIFLNIFALILTFSRTSLVALVLFVILYSIFDSKKALLRYTFVAIVFYIVLYNYFNIEHIFKLFSRGISGGHISTLDYRLYLKKWALDFISKDMGTIFIGVGPSKDYIGQFTTTYAKDLTLRNPDSSFTVWFLRYGFIGLILNYIPYFYMLYLTFKNYSKFHYAKAIFWLNAMLIFISLFDPPYHEPKTILYVWFLNIIFLVKLYHIRLGQSQILQSRVDV